MNVCLNVFNYQIAIHELLCYMKFIILYKKLCMYVIFYGVNKILHWKKNYVGGYNTLKHTRLQHVIDMLYFIKQIDLFISF